MSQQTRALKTGRRKFMALSVLAGMAAAFLRNRLKRPRAAAKKLKVSLYPARFCRKLSSPSQGGER